MQRGSRAATREAVFPERQFTSSPPYLDKFIQHVSLLLSSSGNLIKEKKKPTILNLKQPEVPYTKIHAILPLRYGHEKTHMFLHPLPTAAAHTQTHTPPSLQSYDYLGNPGHSYRVPHLWQGCDFPGPTGPRAVPVHGAMMPKAIICVQQGFLFPRTVLNY